MNYPSGAYHCAVLLFLNALHPQIVAKEMNVEVIVEKSVLQSLEPLVNDGMNIQKNTQMKRE